MHRRNLLKFLVLAPAPVLANCAAGDPAGPPATTGPGKVFYVSPHGDDRAAGLSQGSPWRTITQVNSQLSKGTIGVFDTVLFQCGQTFFGKLRVPANRPTRGGYLSFGSYPNGGNRQRPVISSYTLLNDASAWRQASPNTWATDLSPRRGAGPERGYDGAQGGADNIGFLRVDGKIHGRRVWVQDDLLEQWDFRCAPNTLYVRSSANPTTLAKDIRASCDGHCIALGNSVQVTGLRVEGSGGHGMQGSVSNVRVADNELAELGGAVLKETTRYGNGFEAWINSSDIEVERNILHDIYDVALTAQGSSSSSTGGWRNLAFRNNLIYSCNQSLEFWSGGTPAPGRGFVNCVVECNTCLYAGYVWSEPVRPDQDKSVHLLTYGWDLPADITVRNNTFYDAVGAYRYSSAPTPGLKCLGNVILQRPGGRLSVGNPATVEQAATWVNALRNDEGSTFQVLPSLHGVDVAGALRRVAGLRPGCQPPSLP